MKHNIRNRRAILLIVSAVMLFVVTDITFAVECEDTYYYVLLRYDQNYKNKRVRAFQLSIRHAYIYDNLFLPSSWVYDITDCEGSCGEYSIMTASAKSDKYSIGYEDINKLVIIRQPINKSADKISVGMTVIYMKKEGGIGMSFAALDNVDNEDFTLTKINKCLPIKQQRH